MSTLFLNVSVFPAGSTGASTSKLTCAAYVSTKFLNPPTANTQPPGTADGSTTCNPTGSITGLDNTKTYWLLVYNPQGFLHWFFVNWQTGNSSGAPMFVTVPAVESGFLPSTSFFLSSVIGTVTVGTGPQGIIVGGPVTGNQASLPPGEFQELQLDNEGFIVVSGVSGISAGGNGPGFATGAGGAKTALLVGMTQDGGHNQTSLSGDDGGNLYVNIAAVTVGGGLPITNSNLTSLGQTIGSTGSAVPSESIQVGGSDGTDLRTFLTDTTGQLKVLVENTPAVTVSSGTITAVTSITNPVTVVGDAASGSAVAGNPVLVAGQDGTDARSLLTDNTGQLKVLVENGSAIAVSEATLDATITTNGAVLPTKVQWVGGSDGTDLHGFLVDASGFLKVNVAAGGAGGGIVTGGTAVGSAPTGTNAQPVLVGGLDGTDVRDLLVDTSGRQVVVGAAASGSGVAGNPVLMAGSDGTDARTISTDANGYQNVVPPVNVLLATTAVSVTSTVTTESETAGMNGQCVVVTINCVAAKTMAFPVAVRVRDTTNGIICNWQLSPVQIASGSGAQLYFNLPVTKGDTVDIDIIAQGSVGSGATDVTAVLMSFPVATTLRGDGRSMPLGTQQASTNNTQAAGTVTVITAVVGWRVLVHSWSFDILGSTNNSVMSLNCTLNGASDVLGINTVVATTGHSTMDEVMTQGLLLDADTAVTQSTSQTAYITSKVTYDLVPI